MVSHGTRKKWQRGERPLPAPDALSITHAPAFPQHPAALVKCGTTYIYAEIFSVHSGRSVFYSYLTCFFQLYRALCFKHGDSLTIPILKWKDRFLVNGLPWRILTVKPPKSSIKAWRFAFHMINIITCQGRNYIHFDFKELYIFIHTYSRFNFLLSLCISFTFDNFPV